MQNCTCLSETKLWPHSDDEHYACSSSLYAQHADCLVVAAEVAWCQIPGFINACCETPVEAGSPRNTEHKLFSHRTQQTGLHPIGCRIKQRDLENLHI